MTKDCLVSIKGLQYTVDSNADDERVETINRANFYRRNNKSFITYEEAMESSTIATKNVLKFDDKSLEVTKKGEFSVRLVFEEGVKNLTNYNTPYGNLVVGIYTDKIEVRETKDKINLHVEYDMEINYEHLAKCDIEINVTAI